LELLSNASTHAATTNHSSQQFPAPPHQSVRMVFPYTAFRCSSSSGMRPRSADLACRDSFLCSVLIISGLIARGQSPDPPLVGQHEQSRVPSLGPGCVVLSPPTVLCIPPTPTTALDDFGGPYTSRLRVRPHRRGSPVLHGVSSATCHPCYPGRS
jgi:hypothetical protein